MSYRANERNRRRPADKSAARDAARIRTLNKSDTARGWAIYARGAVDTLRGDALKKQIADCKRHAKCFGISKFAVYAEGASGASMSNRQAILNLIRDAKLGKIGTVIVSDVARISRNELDALSFMQIMSFYSVKVYSIADRTFVDELLLAFRSFQHAQFVRSLGTKLRLGAVADAQRKPSVSSKGKKGA